jgi:16S rRNA processing protein RimM
LDFIEVARIVKPHGIAGELGVLMHWAESDALERVERVRLSLPDGTTKEYAIARVRKAPKGYLLKLVGVDDRNQADALRDALISVDRSRLPVLDEGETFLSDLVGAKVLGPDGQELGHVVEIVSYPSVDCLVIKRADGSTVEQPLVDDWVQPFEPKSSTIVLTSLEGLVD